MFATETLIESSEATTQQTGPLPEMLELSDVSAPAAPGSLEEIGIDRELISDIALKLAYTVPQFSTDWASKQICLPMVLLDELFDQLRTDKMVEVLGQVGPYNYRYAVTNRGREQVKRLLEVSGYVGPAPVSLEAYTAMLGWQLEQFPLLTPEDVETSLQELVLSENVVNVAGMAVSSGRSLFVFGPAGNGKSTLGRFLHNCLQGELWIPHALAVGTSIIQMFDPGCHEVVDPTLDRPWAIDRRWIRIRRPLVLVGGELTLEALDLAYSPALRYYEAPLHVKANGGMFLVDDFGRQRVEPHRLLNRWIVPLENGLDYLTLHTGQQVQMPFSQMLVVATNLDPKEVTDPAFLRRMGYRLFLDQPTPDQYCEIFRRYAARCDLALPSELLPSLMKRYERERRELRSCEPRDLIERARDFCELNRRPFRLDEQILDVAWTGYFGNQSQGA